MYFETDEHPITRRVPKKTKKWCKGKIGTKHKMVVVARREWPNKCLWRSYRVWHNEQALEFWYTCRHSLVCEVCGKTVHYRIDKDQCPEFHPLDEKQAVSIHDYWGM